MLHFDGGKCCIEAEMSKVRYYLGSSGGLLLFVLKLLPASLVFVMRALLHAVLRLGAL